jgi:hypothetical protein
MAMIGIGSSKCAICGRVLTDKDDATGLHHFIDDPKDPFWRFSDSAVHISCYKTWPLRLEWEAKYQREMERRAEINRRWLAT